MFPCVLVPSGRAADIERAFLVPYKVAASVELAEHACSEAFDICCNTSVTTNVNTRQAVKKSIEAATDGMILVNIIELANRDDYQAATYRFSVGNEANFDLNDGSGWGPDYGDPSTYLGTMLPYGAGYMTKSLGVF